MNKRARKNAKSDKAPASNLKEALTLGGALSFIVGLVGVGEHPDLFETELVYGLLDACRGRGYTKEAVTLASDAFLRCEGLPYLILTAADGDGPAFRVAEKCGFLLYERRVRVGRRLTGMPGEAYAYFRKY